MLALVLFTMTLSGCGEKGKSKKTISKLESSIQKGDFEGVLDCVDPKVGDPAKSLFNLMGASTDFVFQIIKSVLGVDLSSSVNTADEQETNGFLSSIKIKPTEYSFNEAKDACDVKVSYSYTINGNETTKETTLKFILSGEVFLSNG